MELRLPRNQWMDMDHQMIQIIGALRGEKSFLVFFGNYMKKMRSTSSVLTQLKNAVGQGNMAGSQKECLNNIQMNLSQGEGMIHFRQIFHARIHLHGTCSDVPLTLFCSKIVWYNSNPKCRFYLNTWKIVFSGCIVAPEYQKGATEGFARRTFLVYMRKPLISWPHEGDVKTTNSQAEHAKGFLGFFQKVEYIWGSVINYW